MASVAMPPASALLLLPAPSSFSFDKVKDAFEPSVSDVLEKLSGTLKGSQHIVSLDIALAIPELLSHRPRGRIFDPLQHYLSSIYTLVGAIAAARDIELDCPGGIDVRVIFVDHPTSNDTCPSSTSSDRSRLGPILDLRTLATSGRPWSQIFSPDNNAGNQLVTRFINSTTDATNNHYVSIVHAVSSSPDWTVPEPLLVAAGQTSIPHYSVAVGGTFDHLHVGHKLLLTATALALEPTDEGDVDRERTLTIGVTGDALLVKKKYAECLESWEERFQGTLAFLLAIIDFSSKQENPPPVQRTSAPAPNGQMAIVRVQPDLVFTFVEFFDTCGPTTTDSNISALALSQETQAGGAIVNEERAKKGWTTLTIFSVDVLQSNEATDVSSFETKISSTEIRRRRMEGAIL
ncbi:Cytidylyltransferase [Penicillium capsulatum]|uniref:Cytidylyltransferase n=1 Tax=Penicillium capsulatum TaxID=69766 RepID=A0A9W9I9Y7_9EURO|nr:Cytidylyltransferase [Penicillium capsulatum]KAJ6135269.1 Cytidylyltransferase [Penicillium capsulatum]